MLLRKFLSFSTRSSLKYQSFIYNPLFRFANSSKSLYQVLGVPQSASQSEIKAAYYKLAKQFHPDVNKGNEEKFKEINSAYETLSDTSKKSQYDDMLKYSSGSGSSTAGSYGGSYGQQQRQQQQYQQYQQGGNPYEQYQKYYEQYRQQYGQQHSQQQQQQQQQQYWNQRQAGNRNQSQYEEYQEFYYDPQSKRYRTRTQQFYEDPNTAYYQHNQSYESKKAYRDFKKRMEEEYRRAEEEYMRSGGQNFDDLAEAQRNFIEGVKRVFRIMLYFFGFFFLMDIFRAIFGGRRQYQVLDPRSNTYVVTDDPEYARELERQFAGYGRVQQQYRGPPPDGRLRKDDFNHL